ncbi:MULTISPECIES: DUF4118 domain-containing protein [unclassified Microbacterium]|uniref:DUF4118 domain-containing protein n=1 Tax=unclassified Microbacterium TaxID=2609290 RepID=UPI003018146C
MRRGRLRVLLGAAPGVGKTYEMLEEGRRLLLEGRDVVIGIVETHGRAATAAQAVGLPSVALRRAPHRGVDLAELDVDAVLARRPDLVLVDELAHTNAPGGRHEKRWQDVEELRDAGIDVITTVNVQHIESLGQAVAQITGVVQRETVPDAVVRGAEQIEVVDLAPASLRDRLAAGHVYPAERIDAALSNYFRLGNLTALRELALLWLADEVDSALQTYRDEHGITDVWQARERVVVALTGGPEGETLLRRGARIAARASGGELLAAHVTSNDGLRSATPGALVAQRALVEALGGSYHQVVGDDVPRTLVEFARSVNATQLVLGASRRSRLGAALSGPGIGATVIRESGDIDVHIVTHAAAGGGRHLPRLTGGALSVRRRILGFVVALAGGPLLSWLLFATSNDETITSDVLAYQLLVVIVALVGGIWPALFAAVLSGFTLDFLFIDPRYTITIDDPLHGLSLVLYVVIAILVSWIVDQAARRTRVARRAAAESELLATVSGNVLRGESAVAALVSRTREAFALAGVRLVDAQGETIASDGEPLPEAQVQRMPVPAPPGAPLTLELHGAGISAGDRRLLEVIVAQLGAAAEQGELERAARAAGILAETDRVRSALLSAVSHDVRRPLAAAMAAVGGARSAGDALSSADRAELLATADESLTALAALMTDLLDVSRIEAGALAVSVGPVDLSDVVLAAAAELDLGPELLDLALDPELPEVRADAVLLQRVVVNLLANARRHAPSEGAGSRVRAASSTFGDVVELRIVDHGPGVPTERQDDLFAPFHRLGDTDNTTGLGLGLALSKGFTEGMGGSLRPEDTPGGGLTMVVTLPIVGARTENP